MTTSRLRSFRVSSLVLVASCFIALPVVLPQSAARAAGPEEEDKPPYPVVVSTSPKNGDLEVDPAHSMLTVTFDRDMGKGMSWTGEVPVDKARKAKWRDNRTCELPVKLEKGKAYRIGINAPSFKNFASKGGEPAPPTAFYFATKGASADEKLKATVPTIVSIEPANGSSDVDPGLKDLKVTFDIAMSGGMSWVGGGDAFPTSPEGSKAQWSQDKKTCTLPVTLIPDHAYSLGLNAPKFQNFRSEAGVPSEPVRYTFTTRKQVAKTSSSTPMPLDVEAATTEVSTKYGKAHPEVQEFVLHTARTFGKSGLWLNENACSEMSTSERDAKVNYLAKLFEEADYGRHLCTALAEASALNDPKLLPGLKKVAAYHVEGKDYDCRAKWMAVAALARQESPDAVPTLVSLVDHGNQNTRFWARAALARMAKDDFKDDKQAWNKWWVSQGHEPIDAALLKPYTPPTLK
ncbi:MAG TPA: HEAT repeat domain-containing protein [Caulifigura sp.]|jgi:RNA polymerase sigma-70 factor (ECF subfamily)|nr:HEAT repeat domain-containing protein [Caulifigura sp.]